MPSGHPWACIPILSKGLFSSGGVMQTGWQKMAGKWYYFSSGGAMVTGKRIKISGKYYTFAADGVME